MQTAISDPLIIAHSIDQRVILRDLVRSLLDAPSQSAAVRELRERLRRRG